jgi:hypothetical protein
MNFNFTHYFVLDVESIGLHGEGYAAAYAVFDLQRRELEAHTFACDPSNAVGDANDRAWVKKTFLKFISIAATPKRFNATYCRHGLLGNLKKLRNG